MTTLRITQAKEGDWLVIEYEGQRVYEGHGDIRGALLANLFHIVQGYNYVTFETVPGEEM